MNVILHWIWGHVFWTEILFVAIAVGGLWYDQREGRDTLQDLGDLRSLNLNGPRTIAAKGNLRAAVGFGVVHAVSLAVGIFTMFLRTPETVSANYYVLAFGLTLIQFVPAWVMLMNRVDRHALIDEVNRAMERRSPELQGLIDAYIQKIDADMVAEITSEQLTNKANRRR